MGWFVVGAHDGISVYNYKNMILQKVTSFTAHSVSWKGNRPLGLGAVRLEVEVSQQSFKEQSGLVRIVAFNPEDHDSFVSGSIDGTIKVLLSLFYL
jgi:WD40 repeat protein